MVATRHGSAASCSSSESKTGKKPLYLSAAAQSVLAEIPRIKDNPHIIAGVAKGRSPRRSATALEGCSYWAAKLRRGAHPRFAATASHHSASWRFPWPPYHRQAARPLTGRHNASLRPFGRRPLAARGGNHREHDCGGDGRREDGERRFHQIRQRAVTAGNSRRLPKFQPPSPEIPQGQRNH